MTMLLFIETARSQANGIEESEYDASQYSGFEKLPL